MLTAGFLCYSLSRVVIAGVGNCKGVQLSIQMLMYFKDILYIVVIHLVVFLICVHP